MSSPVAELLEALGGALGALGVRWYLFGAQAVLVHGGARLTADVDATAAAGSRSIAEIARALEGAGFSARVEDLEAFVERTRVLPLVYERSGMPLDLVLAGPGLEELFLSRAGLHDFDGVLVPVAAAEDMLAMKILAGRPKDLDDAAAIVAAQRDRLDEGIARATLRVVEQALDRSDLLTVLDRLLRGPA